MEVIRKRRKRIQKQSDNFLPGILLAGYKELLLGVIRVGKLANF